MEGCDDMKKHKLELYKKDGSKIVNRKISAKLTLNLQDNMPIIKRGLEYYRYCTIEHCRSSNETYFTIIRYIEAEIIYIN